MARSGSSGDVRVSIGAEVSDLRRGMNEAGNLVREFKEKSERGGGTVRYLSEAFAALGAESSGAGRALGIFSGALAGLAQGGIAGALFAAVGGMVQIFRDIKKESFEATAAMADGLKAAGEEAKKAGLQIERARYIQAGGTGEMFDALHNSEAFRQRITQLERQEIALQDRIVEQQREAARLAASGWEAQSLEARQKAERMDRERAARREEIESLKEKRGQILEAAAVEIEAEQKKKAIEDAKAAKKYDSQKGFPTDADRAAQLGAMIAQYEGVSDAATVAQDKMIEEYQKRHAGERDLFGYNQDAAAGGSAAKRMIDDLAAQDEALRKSQAAWRSWGDTLASTISSVVTNQQTASDAMRGLLSQMLGQFIQYVIQAIAAQAGLTGAKVEGQWADKGPYGWVIGLGQAAAAMAATYAMGKAIGSAAGGWELPSSGGPFPAVLHDGEVVTHKRDSSALKRLDAMADRGELGGGGGGNHYHFHGPVYDARGLYRWVVDNHGQLDDAVGDLKRNGRLRNL